MNLRSKLKRLGDTRRTRSQSAAGEGTRERLIQVARQLFAERGYHHVTVRDISQLAEANLAAVGYHFGDKLSLYRTVAQLGLESLRSAGERAVAPAELSAEEKIRHYVHSYLPRIIRPEGQVEWFQRVIRHEMAQPTPIAQELSEQIFRPRMQYLANLVAEIMDCSADDRRVQHAVFSIQAQCMFYVRDSFRSIVFASWPTQTPDEIRAAADHIADFSLAGIRALRPKPSGQQIRRGPESRGASGARSKRRLRD